MTDANTVPVDTSRERIERLHSIGCADYIHLTLLDERDRYKAQAERAEAALKPFSEEAGWWFSKGYIASEPPDESFDDYQGVMTCGDLFNARATLAQIEAEPVEPRQPTVQEASRVLLNAMRQDDIDEYAMRRFWQGSPFSALRVLAEGDSQ